MFSALGMEIAQPHPGLESRAEPPGRFSHEAPESPGLSENLSWITDYVFSWFFFVKPPFYLEFRELTGTLVGLRGWSLRNVRIREIKWKNLIQTVPVLAWTCQLSPVSRAEAKGAAQALLGYGSSWAPSGMTVFIRTSPRAVESDVLSYALPWRIHGWGCLNMYWGTRL